MAVQEPFKIAISEAQLSKLRQKLDLTVFPDELENSGRKYGAPLSDIQRLVDHWKNRFDWRKQEEMLNNELPQFITDIEVKDHGRLSIHYVHKKSQVVDAIPLLFVHGWPGSFIEVRKILPLLTNPESPEHPSFHVVALSLPGYGFSDAPTKQGFAKAQYAEVANKLMLELGYEKYVTQGGDWGMVITQKMACVYGGQHSMAWHTNFPACNPPTLRGEPFMYFKHLITPYTPAEKAALERQSWMRSQGLGYFMQQATQPQTLGYGLADSPVGLLAWIYEKLILWTDEYPWNDDEALTWVSIYWFSKAGPAASVRIYYEYMHVDSGVFPRFDAKPKIPTGLSWFPKELRFVPKTWRSKIGNVVFAAEHTSGGHFAAHEKPEELVSDLRQMFGKGGSAFGVVPGKTGY